MDIIVNKPKCPFCSGPNIGKVTPPVGTTSYILTTVDTTQTPPAFNPTSGLPVDLYGCSDCKCIYLRCESLKK